MRSRPSLVTMPTYNDWAKVQLTSQQIVGQQASKKQESCLCFEPEEQQIELWQVGETSIRCMAPVSPEAESFLDMWHMWLKNN